MTAEPSPVGSDGIAAARAARTPFRTWLVALVVSLAIPLGLALALFGYRDLPEDIADLILTEAVRLDGEARGGLSLPYGCADGALPQGGATGCPTRLRIEFHYDSADVRPWSVYLPFFQGMVTVSVNGAILASRPQEPSPAALTGGTPMLLQVPAALLRAGDNALEVKIAQPSAFRSFLGWMAIGPDERLRAHFDHRLFAFSTLPQIMYGWQVALGVALLIVWVARPRERMFLLLGAMALSHSLATLPAVMGTALDAWLIGLAFHGRAIAVSLVPPAALLFVGRRLPFPFPVFLILPACAIASYVLLPLDDHAWVIRTIALPLMFVMALGGMAVFVWAGLRDRNCAALMLGGAILSTLVLGVYDGMVLLQVLNTNPLMLVRFGPPIFLTLIGGVLVWRFALAMNDLDRFNARLASAVAKAEDGLRESFSRERAQSRARVLETERVRLMSDLHDGIAGQLVSILALCELPGRNWNQIAGSVRNALADLRLVIASLEDSGDDLGMMLALFRERIEPQLAAFGITLTWQMSQIPELPGLHPGATLNIFRILQEASVNAARHSGSPRMLIEATALPDRRVRLMVRDWGRGGAARRAGSYGLDNMRRRAAALGADFTMETGPSGTTVILDLPSRLSAPAGQ